jgi:DNA-binding XRE family transcriptional regulator
MEDAATFAKVEIMEGGIGIAWPVQTKWGRLDLSGSTLRRIAQEQLPMTGADFSKWRRKLGLSLSEAGKLLGVGRRTIMGLFEKGRTAAGCRNCLPGACARPTSFRCALRSHTKDYSPGRLNPSAGRHLARESEQHLVGART